MRALRCLWAAEKGKGRGHLKEEHEDFLCLLKEILHTLLNQLNEVDTGAYRSLNKFTNHVKKLLSVLGGKEKEE